MDHNAYIAATAHSGTFADRCKRGNMTPAYLPGTVGLKDVRLRASQKLDIRVPTRVGLSSGAVSGSENRCEYESSIKSPQRRDFPQEVPQRIRNGIARTQAKNKRESMKSALYY